MFCNKIVYRLFDFLYMHYENTMWCLLLRRRNTQNEARILDGYSFRQACNLENKMVLSCAWISTHAQPFVIPSPSHKTAALFVLSVIPIRTHFSIIYENSPVHIGLEQEDMTATQWCCFCGEEQSGKRSREHSLENMPCWLSDAQLTL
jgi:hypothetical protein